MTLDIGIVGKGFVGNALGTYLEKKHNVVYYDKFKEDHNRDDVLKDTDFNFICVPTPMNIDGSCNTDAVIDVLNRISKYRGEIIIKSTVPIGFTERMSIKYNRDLIFNPEFLRQDNAVEDLANEEYAIFGVNFFPYDKLNEVYDKEVIYLPSRDAEAMKYIRNNLLAGQVALANEMYNICRAHGIDYSGLEDLILLDDRIGKNIKVPGPDGKLGFGGACFPKDVNALIHQAKTKGFDANLLKEVWRSYGRNE